MSPAEGVRRLALADLETLSALEQAASPDPWTQDQLRAALSDPDTRVLGIEREGGLIGHAVVVRLPFDAELQAILVDGQARRRGLAGRLLTAVIDQAGTWRSERLLLEVRAGNEAALVLYRRAGFGEDGRRRGYYPSCVDGQREDALLMSLPLA
ncbi:ribosomal protein S18-alanine N-acetyltransferase [Halomonas lysinitropha]|uniref:[Ribosomal protein bS18]-alanine N-acetyltransferase n=1 Tax=Halomonas lysinitropha TaxID=2607506 RepID=A0A5K1I6G3_9GAMM|nr:ribosomal protein S18-alanine N-acetyltransferase [Halomonas lysinitropha]VVZ95797.1 ribosomal-protein-alanine N-acetyltransferase [Halomonas lysinitropha]